MFWVQLTVLAQVASYEYCMMAARLGAVPGPETFEGANLRYRYQIF